MESAFLARLFSVKHLTTAHAKPSRECFCDPLEYADREEENPQYDLERLHEGLERLSDAIQNGLKFIEDGFELVQGERDELERERDDPN